MLVSVALLLRFRLLVGSREGLDLCIPVTRSMIHHLLPNPARSASDLDIFFEEDAEQDKVDL